MKNRLGKVLLGALGGLVAIQLVPYGREHSNPPVVKEPAWSSPAVRALAARACFDCHSNETRWPWYSHVAPASWFVQGHTNEGRSKLNFSEWQRPQRHAHDAAEEVEEREMPPLQYTIAHPEARFTDAERAELVAGLAATLGRGEHGAEHDD